MISLLQQGADPFQVITDLLNSPVLRIALQAFVLIVVALWVSLVYWTYTDAGRRGALQILWGIVAVLLPFLGSLIYLIVRPPEDLLDHRERELELAALERQLNEQVRLCPKCRSVVEKDFLICPECGTELKRPCVSCGRPLEKYWGVCPYCEAGQKKGEKYPERGG